MKAIIVLLRWIVGTFHKLLNLYPSPEGAHTLFVRCATWPILKPSLIWLFKKCQTPNPSPKPIQIEGLCLEHPFGVAAGFDKNGVLIEILDALGFGFIEVGTVTPNPQIGNPKPRIHKWRKKQIMINAMGFNNDGILAMKKQLSSLPKPLLKKILVSISKNKNSPALLADFGIGCREVWHLCGGITVNLSSPNTQGLRGFQSSEEISAISDCFKKLQDEFGPTALYTEPRTPALFCKLSPDLSDDQLKACLDALRDSAFSGVILTNTTIDLGEFKTTHTGGLSGRPLKEKADRILKLATQHTRGTLFTIGVGGILSQQDASDKFSSGARAIQLYSGLIFKGPGLLWQLTDSAFETERCS